MDITELVTVRRSGLVVLGTSWYHQEKSTWRRRQVLDPSTNSGRRDWIRTNDPHHVKVVL
jgi:hypothetical protein